MLSMTDPIRSWAKRYVEELDNQPPPRSLPAQRARLLFAYRSTRARKSPRLLLAIAGAGSLLALAVALVLGSKSLDAQLRPQLSGMDVAPGTAILTESTQQELTFPGGSRVIWKESSEGALSKYSKDVVELTLDSGSMALDITHQAGKSWVVRAGDFRVYVVGTAFTVDHDRGNGSVEVGVIRGRVRVEGPHIGEGRLTLEPGERFVWSPDIAEAPQVAEAPHDAEATPPAQTDEAQRESAAQAERPPKSQEALSASGKKDGSPSWQQLAKQGEYALAIKEVERQGTGPTIERASADEKVLLGNAARYSGQVDLALRAYKSARAAPGPAATLAAYYLAKAELDANGNSAEAIRWFRTYLKEAQAGELASSARARLMSLLDASGDRAGALLIAREYLALHPQGPHAQAAHQLIEGR